MHSFLCRPVEKSVPIYSVNRGRAPETLIRSLLLVGVCVNRIGKSEMTEAEATVRYAITNVMKSTSDFTGFAFSVPL